MSANTLTTAVTKAVITLKTIGTPFNLTLGGSGTLSAGINNIPIWDGTSGYGYACAPTNNAQPDFCDATIRSVTG